MWFRTAGFLGWYMFQANPTLMCYISLLVSPLICHMLIYNDSCRCHLFLSSCKVYMSYILICIYIYIYVSYDIIPTMSLLSSQASLQLRPCSGASFEGLVDQRGQPRREQLGGVRHHPIAHVSGQMERWNQNDQQHCSNQNPSRT